MKTILPWTGAIAGIALSVSLAWAQPYCSPVFHVPLVPAPDARGTGFYAACPNGMVYGPNYWLQPSTPPFNGPFFAVGQKVMTERIQASVPAAFPTHPYVRGPRDFFMWRENMEDQMRREQRPGLVP